MMSLRSTTLLTRTQKLADDGTAVHGDAGLDRFNLLTPLLQTKKKARWAMKTYLTCDFTSICGAKGIRTPDLLSASSFRSRRHAA